MKNKFADGVKRLIAFLCAFLGCFSVMVFVRVIFSMIKAIPNLSGWEAIGFLVVTIFLAYMIKCVVRHVGTIVWLGLKVESITKDLNATFIEMSENDDGR